jgi:hypothetical protein
MPIPENCARVHLNFTLAPDEIAVTTFAMQLQHGAGNTLDWNTAVGVLAQKAGDKWRTSLDSQRAKFGPHVTLDSVTAYHLNADTGKTMDKGIYVPASKWQGQGAGGSMPNEVAAAVTLYAYPQGQFVADRARRRGRMFLPPMDATTVAGLNDPGRQGRMSAGQRDQLATALGAYFNDIHHMAADGSDSPLGGQDWWSFGVLSRAGAAFHRVEWIALGDVFDAQRRRRNAQGEVVKSVTISDG